MIWQDLCPPASCLQARPLEVLGFSESWKEGDRQEGKGGYHFPSFLGPVITCNEERMPYLL